MIIALMGGCSASTPGAGASTGTQTSAGTGQESSSSSSSSTSTSTSTSSTADSSSSSGEPGEDRFAIGLAKALCGQMATCSCPNYDPVKCVPLVEETALGWQDAAATIGLQWNETCWSQLLEALESEDCNAVRLLECYVFAGDGEEGDSCTAYSPLAGDCTDDLFCRYVGEGNFTCGAEQVDVAPLQEGEPCLESFTVCDPEELRCDPVLGVCVVPPPVGAPCETGVCERDAWCDFDDDDGPVCKARAPDGALCEDSSSCASGFCDGERCAALGGWACFLAL